MYGITFLSIFLTTAIVAIVSGFLFLKKSKSLEMEAYQLKSENSRQKILHLASLYNKHLKDLYDTTDFDPFVRLMSQLNNLGVHLQNKDIKWIDEKSKSEGFLINLLEYPSLKVLVSSEKHAINKKLGERFINFMSKQGC